MRPTIPVLALALAVGVPSTAMADQIRRPGYTGPVLNDENADRRHTNALVRPFVRTPRQGLLAKGLFRAGAGPVVTAPERQRRR